MLEFLQNPETWAAFFAICAAIGGGWESRQAKKVAKKLTGATDTISLLQRDYDRLLRLLDESQQNHDSVVDELKRMRERESEKDKQIFQLTGQVTHLRQRLAELLRANRKLEIEVASLRELASREQALRLDAEKRLHDQLNG